MSERKGVLLRLDPAVHDALARWASDELRSTNAQIEFLLRRALADAGLAAQPCREDAQAGPAAAGNRVRCSGVASTASMSGGEHDGALVVRVSAPAVDGRATDAALSAIAAAFGVRRRDVALIAGATSRTKIVDVAGADPADLDRLLSV